MRRILKDTGSIYLHCDPTMSHYLKLVMDAVFGRKNFRNEIVWWYKGNSEPSYSFPSKHDIILFFEGGGAGKVNRIAIPYAEATIRRYNHEDAGGRYKISALRGGVRQKIYMKDGKAADDVWEIPVVRTKQEKIGYPTQKPLSLLERIINASSRPHDVVLDPFCGCATACIAAEMAGRQWVGIDISPKAADLVAYRMHKEVGLFFGGAHRTDTPRRTDIGTIPRYNAPENLQRLYGLQAGNCAGCKTHFELRNLEIDHIISRSKGGTDHLDNLQLLCGHCNRVKGNRGMEYLIAKLAA